MARLSKNTIAPISFIEGADMINNIFRVVLKKLFSCFGVLKGHLSHSGKIDLSDIFPPGIEDILKNIGCENRFRMCKSKDEYEKEVKDYYRYHWDSFYLDQNNKDGHFRD
jgi:hypothetical protein